MDRIDYDRELRVATAAVTRAAWLCRAVQAEIAADSIDKKDKSPVTIADFGSQAVICRMLRESFVGDPIVAEEDSAALRQPENATLLQKLSHHVTAIHIDATPDDICRWIDCGAAAKYTERFWTLDPIDGTKGFLRKEQYAIALSLIVDGQPVVAALACPNLDGGRVFTAIAGRGAHVRGIDLEGAAPIRVSGVGHPVESRFCESVESGHSSHGDAAAIARDLGITVEPIRMDSQCKYAVVARGQADIYLRLPTRADYVERIWDHAAGALIITEAGGKVTDIHGRPLEFHHGRGLEANQGIVATNGLLHESVLEAVQARLRQTAGH